MKFSAGISVIALCLSAVQAQLDNTTAPAPVPQVESPNAGVAVISPLLNSTVHAGSNYTIRWTLIDPNATTIDAISVLNGGNPLNLNTVLENILTNGSINATALSYVWSVPTTLAPGTDYALGLRGNNTFVTYSPFFTIAPATGMNNGTLANNGTMSHNGTIAGNHTL